MYTMVAFLGWHGGAIKAIGERCDMGGRQGPALWSCRELPGVGYTRWGVAGGWLYVRGRCWEALCL